VIGTASLSGIACPTSSTCYTVGSDPSIRVGVVVPITNGSVGTVHPITATASLSGIACPSSTIGYAVGFTASSVGVIVPVMGGSPTPVAAELGFSQQPSSTATAGQPFAQQPKVAIQDTTGATITTGNSSVVTLSKAVSSMGSGNFTCTGGLSQTAVSGIATFAGCSFDQLGICTIHAASGSLTPADSTVSAVTASTVGNIWLDPNRNGVKDAGEPNYSSAVPHSLKLSNNRVNDFPRQ
jgi:hypothetical protein